ncbi:MAG: spore germination protein [Halanaerobiales bacterium]
MWNKLNKLLKGNSLDDKSKLHKKLTNNIKLFEHKFDKVDDLKYRYLTLTNQDGQKIKACLLYIESMIDRKIINNDLIKPLTEKSKFFLPASSRSEQVLDLLSEEIINIEDSQKFKKIHEASDYILAGFTILLIDGYNCGLSLGTQGWSERSVSTPNVERTVRGPQESFMENIKVNIGLVRRRVRHPNLKLLSFKLGKFSKTEVVIMYIDGIASSKIVKEVNKRINDIEVGQIIGCSQVAELIEDNPQSIFNTIYESERPDVIAAGIHEGRVAILTDGCPTAQLVPKLFMENFISPEDYYFRFWFTLPLRTMRFVAYLISTLLPAIYVSVISFHQEVVPMTLARTIYVSRQGVPFPILVELFLFLFLFEVIKEAGATVPTALSTSITIVGTLILGQAAITAGFLSADGVIIGSITGITIFLLPVIEFSHALLFVRFFLLFAAAIDGFFGMTIVSILLIVHLASLRSFGVPYLNPVAPLQEKSLKDFVVRVPYFFMDGRPAEIASRNKTRQRNRPLSKYFFKFKLGEKQENKNEED